MPSVSFRVNRHCPLRVFSARRSRTDAVHFLSGEPTLTPSHFLLSLGVLRFSFFAHFVLASTLCTRVVPRLSPTGAVNDMSAFGEPKTEKLLKKCPEVRREKATAPPCLGLRRT